MAIGDDPVAVRLQAMERQLQTELGSRASVQRYELGDSAIELVSIEPRSAAAIGCHWMQMDGELQAGVGSAGNRWELGRTEEAAAYIADLVWATVAGQVVQVKGPGRSRIEVTMRDGQVETNTAHDGFLGLLPVPGWERRGQRTQYEPC